MSKSVVVRIGGGLGNQMINYAVGLSVAMATGRKLILDTSEFVVVRDRSYGLDRFQGPASTRRPCFFGFACFLVARVFQRFGLNACRRLLNLHGFDFVWATDAEAFRKDYDRLLSGACKKPYVAGCYGLLSFMPSRDILRREFVLKDMLSASSQKYLELIRSGTETVSLHVRRSDYLLALNGSPVLASVYYDRAIAWIERNVPNVKWFVFSDDIAWCENHFSKMQNVLNP